MDKIFLPLYNISMKYLILSDLHGSLYHYERIKDIFLSERADKIVMLGDYAYYYGIDADCRKTLASLPKKPIAIEGNCDNGCGNIPELNYHGEMYTENFFSRQICFTHGDRYNISNIPFFLKEGDILCYGHTHMGGLVYKNGLFIANCGSLSRPRFGYQPSYITINETEISLKSSENGEILEKMEIIKH